jgi:hypothetical protein
MTDPNLESTAIALKDYAERVNKVAIALQGEDGQLNLGECVVVLSAMLALVSTELAGLTGKLESVTEGVDVGHKLADLLHSKGVVGFANHRKKPRL